MILSSFSEARIVLGIADLARPSELKSTTCRYVATLAKLGYLQQDPDTRKYSLGTKVIDLGFAALTMELTQVAARHLQALSDETGYSASMAVLDGPDIVYVGRSRSQRGGGLAFDLDLHVGTKLPPEVLLDELAPVAVTIRQGALRWRSQLQLSRSSMALSS